MLQKIALSFVLLLCFVSLSFAAPIDTSVSDILSNPDKYDNKEVAVKAKVISVMEKVSKKGNPYAIIKIKDPSSSIISVFVHGTSPVKNGDMAKVTGTYVKVKKVPPSYTFKNEIDASNGTVEKIK